MAEHVEKITVGSATGERHYDYRVYRLLENGDRDRDERGRPLWRDATEEEVAAYNKAQDPRPRPFMVGDVVVLQSGGTLLTVTGFGCGGHVEFMWARDAKLKTGELPGRCLRLASADEIEAAKRRAIDLASDIPF